MVFYSKSTKFNFSGCRGLKCSRGVSHVGLLRHDSVQFPFFQRSPHVANIPFLHSRLGLKNIRQLAAFSHHLSFTFQPPSRLCSRTSVTVDQANLPLQSKSPYVAQA